MAERSVEMDTPVITDEAARAVREATERAERAEQELAKLKSHARSSETTASPAGAGEAKGSSAVDHDPVRGEKEVHAQDLKQPPTPSTAAHAEESASAADTPVERGSADSGGVEELRKDSMMAHLLDSLNEGKDIGHYGRLVFAMVARHFLPHDEVLAWMTKDSDFGEEDARVMLRQVEGRDYSPPRRERILEWQREQEFPILDVHDPDSGNLYRNLKFPDEVYQHIGHYQEAKASE